MELKLKGKLLMQLYWPQIAWGESFVSDREYSDKEIYDLTGGFLKEVTIDSNGGTTVVYKNYDHHNEPISTAKFGRDDQLVDEKHDYSRTKYST